MFLDRLDRKEQLFPDLMVFLSCEDQASDLDLPGRQSESLASTSGLTFLAGAKTAATCGRRPTVNQGQDEER